CRAHFANDALAAALKDRILRARNEALRPGPAGLPERPFSEAFRAAFRAQGGDPADVFLSLVLRGGPDGRKKAAAATWDQGFAPAVEAQRAALEGRYQDAFAEAQGNPPAGAQTGKKPGLDAQKGAIARLLFGLCTFQAEDAIFSDQSKEAEKQLLLALA